MDRMTHVLLLMGWPFNIAVKNALSEKTVAVYKIAGIIASSTCRSLRNQGLIKRPANKVPVMARHSISRKHSAEAL